MKFKKNGLNSYSSSPVQTESVKKRIEEFEKRAAVAASLTSASKIPVLTPVKKNFVVPTASKNLTVKLVRRSTMVFRSSWEFCFHFSNTCLFTSF